jgi:L-lactate dehydrogenase complex protein LldF
MTAIRPFPESAREGLSNPQLRANLARATGTIRGKRRAAVEETPDWEELREAGRAIKARTLASLDEHLLVLERAVKSAGGKVWWARDAAEANEATLSRASTDDRIWWFVAFFACR